MTIHDDIGRTIVTGRTLQGLPDITLLEPLAAALGVSVIERMRGEPVVNRNMSANMRRGTFYVCPVCGNMLHSLGAARFSLRGGGWLYAYCNRHGLIRRRV